MNRIASILLALVLVLPTRFAAADVASSLRDAWDAAGGTLSATEAAAFQGQAAGYYTPGNLRARTPIRTASLATLSLPSISAGCGGIDIYGGAFSHINAQELVNQLQGIASNAQGFAFQLALRTLLPSVEQVMSTLAEKAAQVNSLNINSCQTAQTLVSGLWPRSNASRDLICASVGAGGSRFGDYAAAKHGCGESDAVNRDTITTNATAAERAQLPDGNYAWTAMRGGQIAGGDWLQADHELAEFIMTLVGTIIINGSAVTYMGPRLVETDKKNASNTASPLVALVEGGSFIGWDCDDPPRSDNISCLAPRFRTITISEANSFLGRVDNALDQVLNALANPYTSTISPAQQNVITATDLPIYRLLNIYSGRTSALIAPELDKIKRALAWDLALNYVEALLADMEAKGVFIAQNGQGDQGIMTEWRHNAVEAYRQFSIESAKRRSGLRDTFRFLTALETAERATFAFENFGQR